MAPIVFLFLSCTEATESWTEPERLPYLAFFFPPLITDLTFFVQKAIKESDPTISNKVRLFLQMFKSQVSQRSWCSGSRHDQQRPAVSDTTRDHYSLSLKQHGTTTPWSWCSVEQLPAIHDAVWNNCPLPESAWDNCHCPWCSMGQLTTEKPGLCFCFPRRAQQLSSVPISSSSGDLSKPTNICKALPNL